MDGTIIQLDGVGKSFGANQVVKNLNMDIREGEFLTFLGPSGCGKTTTLRMIAGFESVTEGRIFLQGQDVAAKKPNERDVNTVFQSYALFPHMNVFDNIAFGLVEKRVKKPEIRQRVAAMVKMVQLEGMERRMPDQLSGGQKQRVAIARALINRPKVLLLDEPLGALDLKLRKQMQFELKDLQRRLGLTFVFVTHDQEEALIMSDRIAVMNEGILEQVGTPKEIYNRPVTKFVADFIGESNIFDGYVEEIIGHSVRIRMEAGSAQVKASGFALDEMVYICVRPENLKLSATPVQGFHILGRVIEHVFIGSVNKTILELVNGQRVRITAPPAEELFPVDSDVYIWWEEGQGVILHTKEDQIINLIEEKTMQLESEMHEAQCEE